MWRIHAAHDAAKMPYRFEFFLRSHNNPGQQIVVPTEIFGGGVEHKINARCQRLQVIGRAEGGINQRQHAVAATNISKACNVHHAQVWVGR